MGLATTLSEDALRDVVDAVYGAALSPERWADTLGRIARLFDGSFADLFTRSLDGDHANGVVHGLDADDYRDQFLGFWLKRNAWRNADPVRVAGEVKSTRELIDVDALRRSDIYGQYLHGRGLHEGLRLSLWVGDRELQVLSVLRPWAQGAFGADELALGRTILPHLQRAAAANRLLRGRDFELDIARGGGAGPDVAALAFDGDGRPIWTNAAAETLLGEGDLLRRRDGSLAAATPAATAQLQLALARAVGRAGPLRQGGAVALRPAGEAACRNLVVMPVSNPGDWALSRPPAAVAFLRHPQGAQPCRDHLSDVFDLTRAEAELATRLLDGGALRQIATDSGRSINTVRTHLSRLMAKTGTDRQVDLIRLLGDVAEQTTAHKAAGGSAAPGRRPAVPRFAPLGGQVRPPSRPAYA